MSIDTMKLYYTEEFIESLHRMIDELKKEKEELFNVKINEVLRELSATFESLTDDDRIKILALQAYLMSICNNINKSNLDDVNIDDAPSEFKELLRSKLKSRENTK